MIVYVNLVQSQSPNSQRLTAMQFKWSIWKGATSFPIQLTAVGDNVKNTMAPPYAIVLEGFADVFQPLPSGLPLERKMAHAISFELDGKPPFWPIYRMSCLKLQEGKM